MNEKSNNGELAYFEYKQNRDTSLALDPVEQTIDTLTVDLPLVKNPELEATLRQVIHETCTQNDFKALESMLVTNAYDLNRCFHKLLKKASEPAIVGHPDRLKTVIDLALKAQRQMTSTVDLLSRLKNPPASTLIQQNIAQTQQVNNGIALKRNQTNELYIDGEAQDAKMDTGKP